MDERYIAAINAIESAVCERYRVSSVAGLGALEGAIAAARKGNLEPLTDALDGREMYRWRAAIDAALEQAKATVVPAAVTGAAPLGQEEPPATESAEPPRRTRKRMEGK